MRLRSFHLYKVIATLLNSGIEIVIFTETLHIILILMNLINNFKLPTVLQLVDTVSVILSFVGEYLDIGMNVLERHMSRTISLVKRTIRSSRPKF